MAPSSTRSRALGFARRLAMEALQRLAEQVDRLSHALEPVRSTLPLRAPANAFELEVRRQAGPRPQHDFAASTKAPEPPTQTPEPPSQTPAEPSTKAPEPPPQTPEPPSQTPEPPSQTPEPPQPNRDALPSDALPPEIELVAHLRAVIEPSLALLRTVAEWPRADDPADALHRARVATRRLRVFARLFAPVLGDKRAHKLQQRLRTITRGLGPVREWDVLQEALRAEHATADPLARAALEHVMAWARARHRKAARKATATLDALDAAALAATLDAELDRVCGRMLRQGAELPAEAATWLGLERERAFEGMPTPQLETDMEALHEVRIRAKQLRYAIELLQPVLDEPHRALRPVLKRVQSSIGDHRDATQLAHRLQARRAALAAEGLQTLAGALEPVEAAVVHRKQRAFERAMRALEGLEGA